MSNETKLTESKYEHKYSEQELLDEIARLKEFKHELIYLVDRLGHQSGDYCGWDKTKRDSMSAKEWADIVWNAANETAEWEKCGIVYRALEKIKE